MHLSKIKSSLEISEEEYCVTLVDDNTSVGELLPIRGPVRAEPIPDDC
jgi:hypothetical protein